VLVEAELEEKEHQVALKSAAHENALKELASSEHECQLLRATADAAASDR